jgi:hypothetical protein
MLFIFILKSTPFPFQGPKALEWVIDELAQDLDGGIRLMDNLMS